MCGSRARTNFPLNSSSASTLSPSLVAKLEKCCIASQDEMMRAKAEMEREEMKCMDDEFIEEMIEELRYYGSMEISSSYSSSSSTSCSNSIV
ncbi:hypothetical protein IEQ34_012567 [Dendrobium chrysotoxum]|uniref:Uncharacterized protein n=1 Tax=Dendrobium chrysotoxum TaxID=161865 RepID=A0AAV7GVT0_DENCH|nr:hypothetical protein IEQ34_012567 [Dendrobium chrysotoxum]